MGTRCMGCVCATSSPSPGWWFEKSPGAYCMPTMCAAPPPGFIEPPMRCTSCYDGYELVNGQCQSTRVLGL